ncbi:hypothetical protein [Hymenobacter sp. 102]|uniref:hypothetical protein n=1 Tax=Hymenobacter sp. 102 TaxID=3403152 RepID=UPI003CF0639F
MAAPNALYLPLFPLGFAAFWAFVCWLISRNGWQRLGQYYRAPATPPAPAETFWLQAASLREPGTVGPGANYRGVLRISCGPAGLGLSVLFLFRVGHPPLLIPWAAVGPVEEKRGVFGLGTYFTSIISAPDGTAAVEIRLGSPAVAAQIEAYQQLLRLGR